MFSSSLVLNYIVFSMKVIPKYKEVTCKLKSNQKGCDTAAILRISLNIIVNHPIVQLGTNEND